MKTRIFALGATVFLSLPLFSQPKPETIFSTTSNHVCAMDLTDTEKADLLYMREEEKLARDVYLLSYDLYGMKIFYNISQSEQRHMDYMKDLLESYNMQDPASGEKGVFTNVDLQTLYNDLAAKSKLSLLDALIAGATIEDLDIRDLDNCLAQTGIDNIKSVYDKLNCASGNHMRAFSKQIVNQGGMYVPQYLSDEKYQRIIAAQHEKCAQK